MAARSISLKKKAAQIRLAVFDVDGVMTDGKLYIGANGMELKAVHIHDGHGLKLLQRAGIEIAVISGRRSDAMEVRLAQLGVQQVFMGVEDKLAVFSELLNELGLLPRQACFMGDDEPDIGPMRKAGLALTVKNAMPVVRAIADWTSTHNGGDGAVREACELLLAARKPVGRRKA